MHCPYDILAIIINTFPGAMAALLQYHLLGAFSGLPHSVF
jgi:hypothetical protein